MAKINTGIALIFAILLVPAAAKAVTITKVSEATRPSSSAAVEVSGITWAGDNLYYAVDDNDKKLYPLTLAINLSNGSLSQSGITIGTGVQMSDSADMEGCAFDPASGNVWISQESGAKIREFNPATGTLIRSAPVPAIQNQYYGNYSLEALTISGDGLTMWTANEEALKCDGTNSTQNAGSTVRLTKFTRTSVRSNWTPAGQWAYLTQAVGSAPVVYNNDVKSRSGVAGLCALPDGTLLVLERNLHGSSILSANFYTKIYEVDFTGATDVSSMTALKGASYTRVTKTLRYNMDNVWVNYEGICLGPRLNDGSCTLVLVADGGGTGSPSKSIMTMKLSGLNVRTLNVAGAADSEPIGGPYRYVDGSMVTVSLPSEGNPYETSLRVHPAWTTSSHSSGQGSVATFAISADDTLRWSTTTNSTLPLLSVDSFERIPVGTEAGDLSGWTGDGEVAAKSYTPALPPGYPLQDETHTQVLVVDGEASRSYTTVPGSSAMVDAMLCVTCVSQDSPAEDAEGQVAIYFAEDGRATLQHRSADGATRLRTPLSSRTFANNDWVRASLTFNYPATAPGAAWCQVRINGEPCVTDAGVRSPEDPVSPGSWYRTLGDTATKVGSLAFLGTGAVDDIALYAIEGQVAGEFEFDTSAGSTTNGVPYAWFNEQGLAWDPTHDMDGDTYTARDEFAAGTNPWDATDFLRILATDFDEEGRFRLYFNGEAEVNHYIVDEVEDLVSDTWLPATGYGQILQSDGTNVWTQATQPQNAAPQRFFRVRAIIPAE